MKRLIVNADDLGLSPGVNRGIIEAHERGIVTSASLMVRPAAAREAAEYAKGHPALGVGLHLDFCEWEIAAGEWRTIYEVVDLRDAAAVRSEVERQLAAFIELMDRPPTHIDSHQHVHRERIVWPVVEEIGSRLGVPVRHLGSQVKYCGDYYGQDENGEPYHQAISAEALIGIIDRLSAANEPLASELACHPGYADGLRTMYRVERAMEVAALCDPAVFLAVQRAGIALIHFGQLVIRE